MLAESHWLRGVTGFFCSADEVLRRQPWTTRSARPGTVIRILLTQILVFSMFYGFVMGSFGGLTSERIWQVLPFGLDSKRQSRLGDGPGVRNRPDHNVDYLCRRTRRPAAQVDLQRQSGRHSKV